MAKGFLIKLLRFWGWVLFIFSCVMIAGLIASSGEGFEFGLVVFFAVFGGLGFLLTRYKKVKKSKTQSPEPLDSPAKDTPKRRRNTPPEPAPEVIETSRQELGIPPGKIFHILYEDSSGQVTERDIEIVKTSQRGEKLYIYAFCHLRLAVRLFLVDRIISMTENGQKIDIYEYLNRDFTPLSGEDMAILASED